MEIISALLSRNDCW